MAAFMQPGVAYLYSPALLENPRYGPEERHIFYVDAVVLSSATNAAPVLGSLRGVQKQDEEFAAGMYMVCAKVSIFFSFSHLRGSDLDAI